MKWNAGSTIFKVRQKIRCLFSCKLEVKSLSKWLVGVVHIKTRQVTFEALLDIIAKNGEVVAENFTESEKGTDKTTGKYKGRRLAEEVSLSHSGGYVLVGVAGMEYAAAVEAKGYEVVSGANTQCEKYLRDTLKSVFRKI